MNIENIDNIVYNYIFDIEEIKRCWYLYMQCSILIERCNEISKSDKNRIKRYHNDFKKECRKLIKRIDTDTAEIYDNRINTLILINSHILGILNQRKYRRKKEIKELSNQYSKVEKKLGVEGAFTLFINNNYTAVNILLMFITFSLMFVFAYFTKDIISCLISLFLGVLLFLVLFVLKCDLKASFQWDRLNRIKSNYIYRKSKKTQSLNKFSELLFNKTIDKI